MPDNKGFNTVGICGGGKMGTSFFKYLSNFQDYEIVFYMRDKNKAEKMKGKSAGTKASVRFTDKIDDLGDCDIVFEFVAEDIGIKRQVLQKLIEVRKRPSQLLATGSSSFTPGRISESYDSYNLIGVHYIYPIQIIKTVEIVFGKRTPPDVIDKVSTFIESIEKLPVRMDDGIGCITTRVLSAMGNEAFRFHDQYGISFRKLDEIIDKSGYSPSPFELCDSVGLDTIYNCISGHFEYREEFSCFQSLRKFLLGKIKSGHLGKKSGEGFYNYTGEDNESVISADVITEDIYTDMIERTKTLFINSSFKLIEGCYVNCEELDGIFREINGTDNGPADTLFKEGAQSIVGKLRSFSQTYGSLYNPLPILDYTAKYSHGREEIDGQIRDFKMGGKRPGWCY